jgi:hypothetical protein
MVMNRREKILILTGSFGEGHQQAAKIIQEAAKIKYQNVETSVCSLSVIENRPFFKCLLFSKG